MNLSRLIERIASVQPVQRVGPSVEDGIDISGIHYCAQAVEKGGMFVAVKGQSADGHDFIHEALKRGAAAVVTKRPVSVHVPCLTVKDTRRALSSAAAEFYGNPSGDMTLVGITGTNGKTTTAFLVESIFQKAGFRTGIMGTIFCRYAGRSIKSPMTTPESLDLQRMLAEMKQSGVTHVVMEVSSHALFLSRVEDCWMDVGIFTNLSQDHLDFHKDMESYWESKKRLFSELLTTGPKKDRVRSVFNCNNPRGRALLEQFPRSGIGVGFDPENAIWAKIVKSDLSGIQAMVHTPAGPFEASSPLVGLHNLENMLCATGAGFALGLSLETIRGGLEAVTRVPGRFETVPDAAGRHVVIDFAHTPDALENTLKAIRALNPGRVITVFGCGGNRDREKRPLMGEIAGRLSDWVIITSDNPRNEDPNAIIEQIRKGVIRSCPKEGDSIKDVGTVHNVFWIEPDRRSAIRIGIRAARPGDAVLIAGKGHETYQIRGDETVHFDDREEAMAALSLKEREGSVQ